VEIQKESDMSFDPKHYRELVNRPALKELNLWSLSAEELLMLTLAVESDFGKYLRQNGRDGNYGVGRSPLSIEPDTFKWLKMVFSHLIPERATPDDLITDLKLATKIARLRYRVVKEELPRHDDIRGLAEYWKKWYNASPNGGTVEEAIRKYKLYVKNKK